MIRPHIVRLPSISFLYWFRYTILDVPIGNTIFVADIMGIWDNVYWYSLKITFDKFIGCIFTIKGSRRSCCLWSNVSTISIVFVNSWASSLRSTGVVSVYDSMQNTPSEIISRAPFWNIFEPGGWNKQEGKGKEERNEGWSWLGDVFLFASETPT